ncbi:hypothetical protein FALCPG4_009591 [Fusarium falciforme]
MFPQSLSLFSLVIYRVSVFLLFTLRFFEPTFFDPHPLLVELGLFKVLAASPNHRRSTLFADSRCKPPT